ncbi:hypothetical protein Pfo_024639 [Paulownia fortunei]|nr:hypothetical protein Pfo_024639 [Paulownia fortunei]
MPDMDGFKLLEEVGLEMDIPVILLSSHDDKERVMKGITHGACDYLLKPVRIEELKNIWQHVVRRKLDSKQGKNSDKAYSDSGEMREALKGTEIVDQNAKPNKKRKDQNKEEDEECEEKGQQYDDPSTQKKPRFVWLPELHRKFVAAVNQLGLDKAVPKRILELMDVENITRENVASHLQANSNIQCLRFIPYKYRMYLKKSNGMASPQANLFASFGSGDSAYGQLVTGVDNTLIRGGAGQCIEAGYRSYPAASMLSRLNGPGSQGLCDMSSSGIIQWGQADNLMNTNDYEPNIHSSIQTMNQSQSQSVLHGMPMPLEFDNGEQNKDITPTVEFSSTNFDPSAHALHNDFSNTTLNMDGSVNCDFAMLEGHLPNAQQLDVSGNWSSTEADSLTSDFSSKLPKFDRYNDNWPSAVQSPSFCPPSDLRDNMPISAAAAAHLVINPHEFSSLNSVVNIKTDLHRQKHPISHIAIHNMNHNPIPGRNILHQEFSSQSNRTFGPENSLLVHLEVNEKSRFDMNNEGFNFVRESDLDGPMSRQLDNAKLEEKPPMSYTNNKNLVNMELHEQGKSAEYDEAV